MGNFADDSLFSLYDMADFDQCNNQAHVILNYI